MIAETQLEQLRSMSIPDKLAVMEVLWEEWYRTQDDVPVPAWQERILRERVAKVESGVEIPIAWDVAKARRRILEAPNFNRGALKRGAVAGRIPPSHAFLAES